MVPGGIVWCGSKIQSLRCSVCENGFTLSYMSTTILATIRRFEIESLSISASQLNIINNNHVSFQISMLYVHIVQQLTISASSSTEWVDVYREGAEYLRDLEPYLLSAGVSVSVHHTVQTLTFKRTSLAQHFPGILAVFSMVPLCYNWLVQIVTDCLWSSDSHWLQIRGHQSVLCG